VVKEKVFEGISLGLSFWVSVADGQAVTKEGEYPIFFTYTSIVHSPNARVACSDTFL